MKLYIKQKVFSWKDKFRVFDENQNEYFTAESEFFTFGKKLHIFDDQGREAAFIREKVMSWLPRYYIYQNDREIAEVVKKITLFKPEYIVNGLGWRVSGDFWAHEYSIQSGMGTVAVVSKRWLTWGDTYEINITDMSDTVNVLCVVLIIDAVLASDTAAASAGTY